MTVVTDGFAVVAAPPIEPPRVGLIPSLGNVGGPYLDPPDSVAEFTQPAVRQNRPAPLPGQGPTPAGRPGMPGGPQRWQAGFRYAPEQTCLAGGVDDPCAPADMVIPTNPDVVASIPGLVWAGDRCSSFGWEARDYRGRAQRALIASESKQIAKELWVGTQAQTASWPNRYLASPLSDTLSNGPMTPGDALACLEQALAECSNGQRGMIHCTRQLGARLSELGSTFRASTPGLILTYMDTIIVPDAGYDGSGPNGQPAVAGSQWAYATLMVTVRRSPIELIPDTFEEALDRTNNTVEFRAERLASASFPTCCHLAVEVDVPLCLVGGAS